MQTKAKDVTTSVPDDVNGPTSMENVVCYSRKKCKFLIL